MTVSGHRIPKLKEYAFKKLSAATELKDFRALIKELSRSPSFAVAEAACRKSRTLAISIEEEAWALGAEAPQARMHRSEAIDLLGIAADRGAEMLPEVAPSLRRKAQRFFVNIAARKAHLADSGVWSTS